MKAVATSGPIVVINVSSYRCDALIIGNHGLRTLPLPGLLSSDIWTHTVTLAKPESLDTQLLSQFLTHRDSPRRLMAAGLGYGGFLRDLFPNFLSTQ